MEPDERQRWAFRTWTILQGRLAHSPNHGLVCGFTSSVSGEGRSTWVHLLARAASSMGFRVLTIATQPSGAANINEVIDSGPEGVLADAPPNPPTLLPAVPNVLASPLEVTQKLTAPDSQPVLHIPLPGWVWNLERRLQWKAALNHWRRIDKAARCHPEGGDLVGKPGRRGRYLPYAH